jgi:pimeloyl-ACP methyl ester carboxylesterase
MRRVQFLFVVAVSAAIAVPHASFAQSHPEFIALGRVSAALYKPDTGSPPHVGFVIGHRTANYLNHIACRELSSRGFLALCFNTRFQNNETQVRWEETPLDVRAAVEFVRRQPGITKVILFGHSGGGPLMSFYQAVAEHGAGVLSKAGAASEMRRRVARAAASDAIVFADAHAGNPVQALRSLNPSVTIEGGKRHVDPALDPFDEKNGFNPNGASHYSKAFQDRYFAAQATRMNELIDRALAVQERIRKGDYSYPDDDILLIPSEAIPAPEPGATRSLRRWTRRSPISRAPRDPRSC